MDTDGIRKALFKRYLLILLPAAVVLLGWAAFRNLATPPAPLAPETTGPAAFIGAVAFALALPLFLRDRFVKSVAKEKSVPADRFLSFELSALTVGLLSAYFAAAAYVCAVSQFHFGGSFLAALYAAYYYFPSRTRVAHEMRLFRVPSDGGPTE